MITDRCFYFPKTQNECDLAAFRLDENSVNQEYTDYTAERHVGRPDLLAHELMSDWQLWWAVLRMNKIEDPFNDIERGMIMGTPRNEFIHDYLKSKKS